VKSECKRKGICVANAFEDDRIIIAQMRVRGARPDRLRSRQRLETLLSTVDLYPSGLPAAAILYVRSLPDPLPGTLRLEGHALPSAPRWTGALASSLAECARNAVRPLYDTIPANAQAVLFADRSEMLACLARDWAQGLLLHHWWWQRLLQGPDATQAVWSAWMETPQYVPPALAHLAAHGEAAMVVQRMDETIVQALLKQIYNVFHLRDLEQALETPLSDVYLYPTSVEHPFHAPASQSNTSREDNRPLQTERSTQRMTPPWAVHVRESLNDGLSVSRRLLIGTALSLVHNPTRVRMASFAWETRHWLEIEIALERGETVIKTPPSPAARVTPRHEAASNPDELSATAALHPVQDIASQISDDEMHTGINTPIPTEETLLDRNIMSDQSPGALEAVPVAEPETIITKYGGLFYLLNLAVHLGFYADYTAPLQQELELSIWDFVTLVGCELLGEMPHDPVWGLLARLAGRDDLTPAGNSFTPPDIWLIDTSWLKAFPNVERSSDLWLCEVYEGRMRIMHSFGFLVADVFVQGDAIEQAAAICALYDAEYMMQLIDLPPSSDDPLRRWLDWLMPYIRARLQKALSVDDVAALLIPHAARVFVTPAHVDVKLDLNTLPIEIRLAGLDRNPNWLAAAGRTVTFHFESGLS
jgi:hypothetical protein